MKKLVLFLSVLFIACMGLFAQDTLSLSGVITQGTAVYNASVGYSGSFRILFFAAVLGVLLRTMLVTIKGIKSTTNGSPLKFAFSYWIADNALPKIATILTLVISSGFLGNLPTGLWAYVLFAALGLIIGYFLDYIYNFLQNINPKASAPKQVEAATPTK